MGRSTWLTRFSGGAALLLAQVAIYAFVVRPGMLVPRWDVVIPGAAALLCTAAWLTGRLRQKRTAPAAAAGPVPAPPGRLRWRRIGLLRPFVLVWFLFFAPLFLADLALQPDAADARRISALQDAGAVVDEVRITNVHALRKVGVWKGRRSGSTYPRYSGDVTLEVPGIHGPERLRIDGARLGPFASKKGDHVRVLHVPGRPGLGGYIDEESDTERLGTGGSSLWGPRTPHGGGFLIMIPVFALLPVLGLGLARVFIQTGPLRVLREDARAGGPLPAVRAEVTAALRTDTTVLGRRAGSLSTRSKSWLGLTLVDGTEIKARTGVADVDHSLPALAAAFAGRPGWLCGAARWRLLGAAQPVVFVTDDGEALWLSLDRETFEEVLADSTVEPDPRRGVRPVPPRTPVAAGSHVPWLAALCTAFALLLPPLLTPSTHALSWVLCSLSPLSLAAAFVLLVTGRRRVRARATGWTVTAERDPGLG
ncbi:hypothetical protein [Streptomyces sp. G1]|uniref:hypothetical protein n=1 Tax=Streptomyces sp. G1 TaxID=361572 RepID=UPI00203043D3|nr:hypothetical protein [Streptomyces sp. G1]MCM1974930.1 hypothetical protein [Streptomyces sp. G1]